MATPERLGDFEIVEIDADGTDLAAALSIATEAATFVRRNHRPAFLRLRTVRLLGHAGSDVEAAYRSPAELAADEELDPLLGTARLLLGTGLSAAEVIELYEDKRSEALRIAAEVAGLPQLSSAEAVAAPLRFPDPDAVEHLLRLHQPPRRAVCQIAEGVAAGSIDAREP